METISDAPLLVIRFLVGKSGEHSPWRFALQQNTPNPNFLWLSNYIHVDELVPSHGH